MHTKYCDITTALFYCFIVNINYTSICTYICILQKYWVWWSWILECLVGQVSVVLCNLCLKLKKKLWWLQLWYFFSLINVHGSELPHTNQPLCNQNFLPLNLATKASNCAQISSHSLQCLLPTRVDQTVLIWYTTLRVIWNIYWLEKSNLQQTQKTTIVQSEAIRKWQK